MDPKIIKGGTAAALPLGVTSKKSSEKELQSGASQLFYLSLYASKANIFITYVFRRTLLDIHTSLTLWELTWAYQILQVHGLF